MKKVLVVCGATATGKSALAVALAKRLDTQIISADSQLIYRGLNIGTAKPTMEEMEGIKHHLIDVVDPMQKFSVSDYREKAKPILENILSQGNIPIICGGTGFYINSLLFNMGYGNSAADETIRLKYENLLAEKGREYLYSILSVVDPESAQKIHLNDTKRVIRALEIYEVTGKRKSEQRDEMVAEYNYVAVAIDYPRQLLYERINTRVDKMLTNGLVDEVRGLMENGVDLTHQSMQAIGYKEVVEYLENGDDFSTMSDIIKQNTRHYAKRQYTFFKKMPNITFLDYKINLVEKVLELL